MDDALERRAQRRQEENKAEASEIANQRARFALTRARILLVIGLGLLALIVAAGMALWVHGERIEGLQLLGSGGILSTLGGLLGRAGWVGGER